MLTLGDMDPYHMQVQSNGIEGIEMQSGLPFFSSYGTDAISFLSALIVISFMCPSYNIFYLGLDRCLFHLSADVLQTPLSLSSSSSSYSSLLTFLISRTCANTSYTVHPTFIIGFGLGFERLIMFVTGLENIRDVIPFPRVPGHADF